MRHIVSLAVVLSGAMWTAGGVVLPAAAQPATAAISPDEQQIRTAATRYVEYFNRRDAKALAGLFAADAVFLSADGTELAGREALEQSFAQYFQENPKAGLSLTMESLRFVSPDVAIEEGVTTTFRDGETPTVNSRYTVMHAKRDGQWVIAGGRSVKDEVLSNYEYLRDLEWLVGDWVDEGADAVIETSTRWSEDKNFLLQDFSIISRGLILLKGTQRIGWDPRTRQIRSWIFDSEGGFAESTWANLGDRWIVKGSGVQKDGTAVSSTRTLVPATRDRITVTMTDRLEGDESRPDIAVTMVRKPPTPQQ